MSSTPRPTAVTVSFVAWALATLLGLAAAVLLLVSAPTAVVDGDSSLTADFFGITFLFAGLLVLAFTVIQGVVLLRMRAGRNWARVTLTVIGVLQAFNAIFSIGLNPVIPPIGIATIPMSTRAMWLPASNAYFGRRTTLAQ